MRIKMLLYAEAIAAIAIPLISFADTAPRDILTTPGQVQELFCTVAIWMFWGLIVLGVAMFLVGGYIYATSNGDPEKVGKATKTLTYAAIAIAVGIIAKGIPSLIGDFLGAKVNYCNIANVTFTPQ